MKNFYRGMGVDIWRAALGSWNLPVIDISDEKQVEERILWYFNHCIENDLKPTVMGMCNALGISRDTFYRWGVGEYRTATHSNLVKKARNLLEELWETYMVEGKINPVVGIFLGKNHFGYADKKKSFSNLVKQSLSLLRWMMY